ncbi:putative quinol monooxygenase [Rubritalea marina]|uniref:putative quinol monooxygenase n=1 Tax=Rubritalea marina TaxID=361055 RepID=UPI0003728457|nr:putative quinol monooxygenase [Rubritalea marina]
MPLYVSATITAKAESIELVRQELINFVAPTLKEDGCVQYLLHQTVENPAQFIFFEEWESQSHLDAHLESDHIKQGQVAMAGHLDEVVVSPMLRVDTTE